MVFVYGFTLMFAFYIACGYYQLHYYTEAVIRYKQMISGVQLKKLDKNHVEHTQVLAGGALLSILCASIVQLS